MLKRMEDQAGRVAANELMALCEKSDDRLDDLGRRRLQSLCREFHAQCAKVSRAVASEEFLRRVQAVRRAEDNPASREVQPPQQTTAEDDAAMAQPPQRTTAENHQT